MAYLIRSDRPAAAEVRRSLIDQNAKALALLEDWREDPRLRVHAARQCFKRLRALLHLARRDARYVFEVENRCYRDLGRSLACLRDADAMIDAVAVIDRTLDDPVLRRSLGLLRRGLEERVGRVLADPGIDVPQRVQAACETLREAGARLRHLRLEPVRRRTLRKGIRVTFERCEARFARALSTGRAPDFHQWRQAVKYAGNQARLMRGLMPRWSSRHEPVLARLGELLGHAQDLEILGALLGTEPNDLGLDPELRNVRTLVAARKLVARAEACTLGAQLFPRVATQSRPLAAIPPGLSHPPAGTANVVDFAAHAHRR